MSCNNSSVGKIGNLSVEKLPSWCSILRYAKCLISSDISPVTGVIFGSSYLYASFNNRGSPIFIETVSAERSKLGAYQNRLEHTINNLSTSSENLTAAESRIRDVDYALAA